MSQALVDTGVWGAHFNRRDADCARAGLLLTTPGVRLVTTWPIVWETITFVCRDVGPEAAADVGQRFVSGDLALILDLTSRDHALAFEMIRKFPYLRLSAADATACALVKRARIQTVMSFDSDFGTVLSDRIELGVNG